MSISLYNQSLSQTKDNNIILIKEYIPRMIQERFKIIAKSKKNPKIIMIIKN